jgi:hypothetical protein
MSGLTPVKATVLMPSDPVFVFTLLALALCILTLGFMAQLYREQLARRRKVRLPVLQPTCTSCARWDREQAKQVFSRFPVFAQAAGCITPAEMAYGYKYDPETDARLGLDGPKEAALFAWDEFGGCSVHGELRHKGDHCDKYEVAPVVKS